MNIKGLEKEIPVLMAQAETRHQQINKRLNSLEKNLAEYKKTLPPEHPVFHKPAPPVEVEILKPEHAELRKRLGWDERNR